MKLKAAFRDIAPSLIVEYLLQESGQPDGGIVNPAPILDLLKLAHLPVDFEHDLDIVNVRGKPLRALLSFPERVIATSRELTDRRLRFSTFHEIGHYVLPEHLEGLFICDERDMGQFSDKVKEKEANAFAADLLFHGRHFQRWANSLPPTAKTIKELADRHDASFESTARRYVEKSIRPCLLVVYEKLPSIDTSAPAEWEVRYSIPSPGFAAEYARGVGSDPKNPLVKKAGQFSIDMTDSITEEKDVRIPDGRNIRFRMEYFSNRYNVFCLWLPIGKKTSKQ